MSGRWASSLENCQCVVIVRPAVKPVWASSRAPVQTLTTQRAPLAASRIQSRIASLAAACRVPLPPGITRTASGGASDRTQSASTRTPCAQRTIPDRSAIESNRSSAPHSRAEPNTSQGPIKSSSSTLSKIRNPIAARKSGASSDIDDRPRQRQPRAPLGSIQLDQIDCGSLITLSLGIVVGSDVGNVSTGITPLAHFVRHWRIGDELASTAGLFGRGQTLLQRIGCPLDLEDNGRHCLVPSLHLGVAYLEGRRA